MATHLGYASLVLLGMLIPQSPAHGPRIAPVPENQRSGEQRSIAAWFASTAMPNAVATYLNHPSLAEHILSYEHYVSSESTLPHVDSFVSDATWRALSARYDTHQSPRHRELLLMRIGVLCRSEYEWAAHSRIGRQVGMSDADVERIVAGPEKGGGDPIDTALQADFRFPPSLR